MAIYTSQQIKEKYREIAPTYDILEALNEILGLAGLRKKLFQQAIGNVLEVAVGTGKNLPYYQKGIALTGVDVSPEMLKIAEKKAGRYKLHAQFKVMDAHLLDFADDSFDTVTSSLSTCTFTNPVKAVEEMVRVCKPHGRILLLEHGRSNKNWINRWLNKKEASHAEKLGCHWNRDTYQLLEQTSLRVLHSKDYFFEMFHSIEAKPEK